MPRLPKPNAEAAGNESFLDVVANMVGILIILVMVVGLRVKNVPITAALPGAASAEQAELAARRAAEESLRADVLALAGEIQRLDEETAARQQQRDLLATAASALEQKIDACRRRLDEQSRADFDLRQSVADSRQRLEQIRQRRMEVEETPAEPIVVENYPTPLSETVDGEEAHFQLRAGRVALIPLEALLTRFRSDAQRQVYKLLGQPELTDTLGPEAGFRLRYTLERVDVSPEMAMATGRGGSYARLKRWTLIPASGQLGEPLDAALAEGSEFRRALTGFRPGRTTITLWTYPDSFEAFRQLRAMLYQQGYAVAGRPLADGSPISGSPDGTKSAAQ